MTRWGPNDDEVRNGGLVRNDDQVRDHADVPSSLGRRPWRPRRLIINIH